MAVSDEDRSLFADLESKAFQRGWHAGYEAYREHLPTGLFIKCDGCKLVKVAGEITMSDNKVYCERCR